LSQTPSPSPRLLHRLQRGLARLAEAESESGLLRVLDEFLQQLPGIACAMLTVVDHLGRSTGKALASTHNRTWLLALPAGDPAGAVAARAALHALPPIEFPIRQGLSGMLCVYSDPTRPRSAAVDSALLDALRIVTLTYGAHLARLGHGLGTLSLVRTPTDAVAPPQDAVFPGDSLGTTSVQLAATVGKPTLSMLPTIARQPGRLLERQHFLRAVDAHLQDTDCVEAALLRVDLVQRASDLECNVESHLPPRDAMESLSLALPEGLPAACLKSGEFALLLAPALLRTEGAPHSLEHIDRQVRALISARVRELALHATFTSALWPRDGVDAVALIRHARAQSQPATSTDDAIANRALDRAERVSMESELHRLLQTGAVSEEMRVVYQPQVGLVDMRLCGVEALLRWRSPRFGEVAPSVFVPILEESGLIVPVGEWMLRQACSQVRRWAKQGVTVRRLAVNLSASQLRAPAIARTLEKILADTGLMASCQLEVEVTESTLMSDAEVMGDLLRSLTDLGVRVAVDDFGRGTCALGWLESFPISGIKVDPLFLGELDGNPDHAQLARAMFDLGRALNLRVSAEGVETASQLAFIRSNGCEEAQGFYLARPLEAEHFVAGTSHAFH